MKIVVLDGFALNSGDLSWEGLKLLGDLTVFDRTMKTTDEIIKAIGDAELIFTNKTPITREVLQNTKSLKFIGVLATGYNIVDVDAACELSITVTNIPSYSTPSVAQLTVALLLEMCHHVGAHSDAVYSGQWSNSADFCFWNTPLIELAGKTIGIIGFGSIGQATAKLAQAFGMNVLAIANTPKPELETETCKFVPLDELFAKSDVISLHCPLNSNTQGIICKETIAKMKDGVMIINTSRGPLVIEEDLRYALNSNKIACAAVDVVSVEPINPGNPLLQSKNCLITPHFAWAPKESRIRLMNIAVANLNAFLNGAPQNVVN